LENDADNPEDNNEDNESARDSNLENDTDNPPGVEDKTPGVRQSLPPVPGKVVLMNGSSQLPKQNRSNLRCGFFAWALLVFVN
jgi:hypothetical protein